MRAAAIRHVPFEDLGTFEPALRDAGYAVHYVDVGIGDLAAPELDEADLLIVLGGPIGAYEEASYPFLVDELALIGRRLREDRPLLGICLGAQLIARALGSRVYPMGTKEIGWSGIELAPAASGTPLRHLQEIEVLHWHGDTFDLPDGCALLASTPVCRNQAFTRGPNLLALQFHPEVDARGLERWLIGHACELGVAEIAPPVLRQASERAAPLLAPAGRMLIEEWLDGLR